MAKIYAPNEQYNGVSASVAFTNGVGECADPVLIEWFRDHGYTVEADETAQQDSEKPLEKMTVAELEEYATRNDIDLGTAKKKEEILAVIKQAGEEHGIVPDQA